jgi:hypothetical protein
LSNVVNRKRKRVIVAILAAVSSNSFVAATPGINMEITKQIFLTLANVMMFTIIWDIYFDEQLSQKDAISILQDLLIVTFLSVVTAYIISKGITEIIDNIINWLGIMGWGIVGIIAGLATSIVGITWAFYCDDLYHNSTH